MREYKLLAALGCLVLFGCANLSDSVISDSQTIQEALQSAQQTIVADLQSINLAVLSNRQVDATKAVKKTQKDVDAIFSKVQKYENKLDTVAKDAAKQGDKYNNEHGFWENLNPFHEMSVGLGIVGDSILHLILIGGILIIALAILPIFFPAVAPFLSAIWAFLHLLLTSLENVGGIAASGVSKLISSSNTTSVPPATK